MNRNAFIGVFDSGAGGLTVAKHVMEQLPNENILFFGDTAHLPYGTKSEKQIKEFAVNDVAFLNRFELKSLIIACNTADSVARETLLKEFDMPIYGVIDPASRKAVQETKNGKIGVMATTATVRSNAYRKAIHRLNRDAEVYQLPCPLLVPLVENRRYKKDDMVVRLILSEYLDDLTANGIDTLVLGCTHYPLLYDAIHDLVPDLNIVSSSEEASKALVSSLTKTGQLNDEPGSIRRFYVSDDAEAFKKNADIFLGENITGEVIQVAL